MTFETKVRRCALGAALGDSIGGPFEFGPLNRVPALTGGDWIDGLYPYEETTGPHGVWPCPPPDSELPPAGTGTDDTRYNWLFLELAIERKGMPTGRDLAVRYLDLYERPEQVFPGHGEWTRQQFAHWEGACRGYLGQSRFRPVQDVGRSPVGRPRRTGRSAARDGDRCQPRWARHTGQPDPVRGH